MSSDDSCSPGLDRASIRPAWLLGGALALPKRWVGRPAIDVGSEERRRIVLFTDG